MIIVGDTVQLKGTFYDFDGNPINLSNVSITVYDKNRNILTEITTVDNPSTGTYEADYTVPDEDDYITVEFKGEFTDGKSAVIRRRVETDWEKIDR